MPWYLRVVLGLAVGSAYSAAAPAPVPKPPAEPKARVELRWMEKEWIAGVTEGPGIPINCDANSTHHYMHKKPVFVITAADVEDVRLAPWGFGGNAGVEHDVTFRLTKKARERLAAACAAPKGRMLAVSVDGKGWSGAVWPTVKDFSIPFHSSKAAAERFADAFK